MNKVVKVNCRGVSWRMLVDSDVERMRVETVETKEPETLAWIETFAPGECF